jgi:hypothetical protein
MQRNNIQNNQNVDDDQIIKIQSAIRGFQVRERYQINALPDNEREDYPAFVIGNDPKMPPELDHYIEPEDKIALVATSGFRAISLACKLGNPNQIPKILLVDNSRQVIALWRAMRDFVRNDSKADIGPLFLYYLEKFLSEHQRLYRNLPADILKKHCTEQVSYLSQDIFGYFKTLINKYDYQYVRKVIMHTSLIEQSWADSDTFNKIGNILSYLNIDKIIMYPSNIVACIDDQETQEKVLNNIEALSPMLSIHTDCCDMHGHPERVMLITNQNPSHVQSELFQSTCIKPNHIGRGMNVRDYQIFIKSVLNDMGGQASLDDKLKFIQSVLKDTNGQMRMFDMLNLIASMQDDLESRDFSLKITRTNN